MNTLLLLLLACLLTSYALPASADTFSCPGGIVSSGDRSSDAIVKCGQPAERSSYMEETIDRSDPTLRRKTSVTIEEWTYDLGPQRLMRIVVIRNGVISEIRTSTYGSPKSTEAAPLADCASSVIAAGDTRIKVLQRCGEPFLREQRYEEASERSDAERIVRTTVLVETWTYNFGPDRFMRIVTMKNGIVTDVQTGGYGMRKDAY